MTPRVLSFREDLHQGLHSQSKCSAWADVHIRWKKRNKNPFAISTVEEWTPLTKLHPSIGLRACPEWNEGINSVKHLCMFFLSSWAAAKYLDSSPSAQNDSVESYF